MNVNPLIGLFAIFIIGVILNSQQSVPQNFSDLGGILALVGGVGLTLYMLKLFGIFRQW